MEAALGIMIPIIAIIGVFTMIIYLRKYENQERMAMIDKGVDPQFFNVKKTRNTTLPLRASLLFIGGGIGLLLGYFLDMAFDMDEVGYFSMLFIFGGIGLGGSYLVEEKKIKEESKLGKE
ncbi:MAG: hypothetical protein OEV74_04795 [Cyclobacteriaceae bacterium]|jgi:hypothetical protein|nr:hypothetical protein [Cyclobacteriaceae bacterium]MDH4295576.1 hypothetical protein [Cyclobacteriaceae bacterium]MDH5249316.1 hypothetical protein [Cyclobacteriaceae bacterium]